MPSVYTGLSEDDMFISKLLAAQNVMVNIQTELTSLIKDYIVIKKKDQKRKTSTNSKRKRPSFSTPTSVAKKAKKSSGLHHQPQSAIPAVAKPSTTPSVVQGMFKTRKNDLTLEEGNKLKQQIAGLSAPQQMTVLEILRENKEPLDQDEEGNVEMEFREFSQKSIDDLKAYVNSVTMKQQPKMMSSSRNAKDINNMQANHSESSDDDSDSDSSSSSDSDSD